jgi:hypothetical protein
VTSLWPRRFALARLCIAGLEIAVAVGGTVWAFNQKGGNWMGGIAVLILLFGCAILCAQGLITALFSWLGLRALRSGAPAVWPGVVCAVLDLALIVLYGFGLLVIALDIVWAVSARRRSAS